MVPMVQLGCQAQCKGPASSHTSYPPTSHVVLGTFWRSPTVAGVENEMCSLALRTVLLRSLALSLIEDRVAA